MEKTCFTQRCLTNEYKTGIDWFDIEYTNEPHSFLKCNCGNELITSESFVSDDEKGVRYICTDCHKESWWDFDLAPVAIEMKGPRLSIKEITESI